MLTAFPRQSCINNGFRTCMLSRKRCHENNCNFSKKPELPKFILPVKINGHVRHINILTWLRGFQNKLLYLVLFSFYPSLPWELSSKRKPRSHVRILIYRTWPIPKLCTCRWRVQNACVLVRHKLSELLQLLRWDWNDALRRLPLETTNLQWINSTSKV